MTVRPPRQFSGAHVPDSPQTALDYEIAQEKASTLGRLGRRLEATLAELAAFDAALTHDGAAEPDAEAARRALVSQAGNALWQFIVQREVLGLRDNAQVLRDYSVPAEVRDRAGAVFTAPLVRRHRRI